MRGRQRVRRKNVFEGGLGFAGVAGLHSLKDRASGRSSRRTRLVEERHNANGARKRDGGNAG
jgi:hypothetical protein